MMDQALSKKLIGKSHHRDLLACLRARLPRLAPPAGRSSWLKKAARIRREVLDLFFRGHPAGLLSQKPRVQWAGVIETGRGYRIRKLRYEGYPGMWVPALLYEPVRLRGKVPAVLNPNGHHAGGKAMAYKQARCINLAKRGMLALNTEFIGMGELRADAEHNRIGHLDLCGIAGVGVFYLLMKRGLDVLLSHPRADHARVAMTGLSGGGWQTALLSALDERITCSVPVAGHSPVWQRTGCVADIGDLEQIPSDLCSVTDFDALTAMLAPRPTLLIYNRNDDCCFQTRRTRRSIYQPVKPYFATLGGARNLGFHDNVDPGTHNYDADNRSQLYRFLNRHFRLDTSGEDLPWRDELRTESELNVGLPPDNATLLSLAAQAARQIRRQRRGKQSPSETRRRLASVIRLPECAVTGQTLGKPRTARALATRQIVLRLNNAWNIPATEINPAGSKGVEIIVGDGGRRNAARLARSAAEAGRRVLVADLFGTGEAACSWQYHTLLACVGERPLGLQVGQLLALMEWACKRHRVPAVHLMASGHIVPVAALTAAALRPARVRTLTTASLMDALHRLIDWPTPYAGAAPLFCFGLLRAFDLPDLITLSAPVPIHDANRGPLR